MKRFSFISILVSAFFITHIKMHAQFSPEGKTYIAHTNSVCKKMEGGGCSIEYYSSMIFTKDKVKVSDYLKASCTPKEREKNYEGKTETKSYNWTMKNNIIVIEKCNEYSKIESKENKLRAQKKDGSATYEFVEQK